MDNRQPVSAARRLLSYLVCYLLAVQPMLPVVAAEITPVTPGTKVDAAGNGVPVINIATPNQAGISHNQYQQYNVGSEGLILNNATGQLTQTRLGGMVQNNTNLKAGQEARAIINEVVGANRSQLQGYTEVAGSAAKVIVANPYGITCNGCGFINTPGVTLTTGKPQLDASGNLTALEVSKGTIVVEGQGLDGSDADAVAIVARATEINAGIHARDLSVTVGANRVGQDGSVTPIAGDGAAPTVAVDTGALGGMYANRIHLVSSENGVGVNLGNLLARQGDIALDANGRLAVRDSLSSGALTARAQSIELSGEHKSAGPLTLTAANAIDLNHATAGSDKGIAMQSGQRLQLVGSQLTAGEGLSLNAGDLNADGASTARAAGNITMQAGDQLDNAGQFVADGNLKINAAVTRNSGTLLAKGQLDGVSSSLANQGILQGNSVTLSSGTVSNSGTLLAQENLTAVSDSLTNQGTLQGNSVSLNGGAFTNAGTLLATGQLNLVSDSLDNQGSLQGSGVTLNSGTLDNGGTLQSTAGMILAGNTLDQSGTLAASGDMALTYRDRLTNAAGATTRTDGALGVKTAELNQQGTFSAGKGITLVSDSLNSGQDAHTLSNGDLSLQVKDQADLNGELRADGLLSSNSGSLLTHAAAHLQGENINLNAVQADLAGTQAASDRLSVAADQLSHTGKSSAATVLLTASGALDNAGSLLAENQLRANAATLSNSGSVSGDNVTLTAVGLSNSGVLSAGTQMQLAAGALDNSGRLSAPRLDLSSTIVDNRGLVQGDSQLTLSAQKLINQQSGTIATAGDLALDLPDFSNGGLLTTDGALSLSGERLSNSGEINAASVRADNTLFSNLSDGKLLATGSAQLDNTQLSNDGLIAADRLAVNAASLDNAGRMQGSDSLALRATTLNNATAGELISAGQLAVNASTLDNAGLLQGNQLTVSADSWRNAGNALSAGDATLSAKNLNNSGKVLGQQAVALRTEAATNNGWLLAKVLAFQGDLHNSGVIQGNDALTVSGNQLVNQADGQLQTAGALVVSATSLDNQGSVQAQRADILADDWQNSGDTRTSGDLAATVSGALSNGGALIAQQQMALKAAALNNSGTLAADGLTLSAPQLTNGGLLQGNSSLALDSAQIANQAGGRLISGGALSLHPAQLSNDGLLQVADLLDIRAADFSNGGEVSADALSANLSGTLSNSGKLLVRQQAELQAQTLNNAGILAAQQLRASGDRLQNQGLMQGDAAFSADFRQLDTLAGGQLLSGGELALQADNASNAGSWQGAQLSGQFAALSNTGTVNGTAGLEGHVSGVLDNAGSLLSGANASLSVGSLLNRGKIIAGDLSLNGTTLNNSGLWQGSNALTVQADGDVVQDSSGKTLSGGSLLLSAAGLNTAGIVQGSDVSITADDWLNSASLLVSGSLTSGIGGTLSNSGALLTQGALQISADSLINNGSLLAEKATLLNGSSLNNSGAIQGETLTIRPASVTNQGSLTGLKALTLAAAPQLSRFRVLLAQVTPTRVLVNNAGGQLLTQGTLTVSGDTLTNNGSWQGQQILLTARQLTNNGSIQSADALQLNLSERLDAAAGSKISANGAAALHALALSNQGQWIARNLTITGDTLNNNGDITGVDGLTVQLNGALTQQQDKTLLSAGKLTVQAATVNNAGRMQGGELELTSGTLDNNGRLQGDNNLLLTTSGRLTNNANGTVVGGNTLTLTTPELYNYGLIQGVTGRITASGLASNAGRVLTAGELIFTTPQLVNNGWLQAGQLTLNAANTTNNGTLLADQQGTLTGSLLQNQGMTQGGNLAVNYQQLNNNGTLLGTGLLNVNAAQINQQASGRLFSAGNLTLTSNGLDLLGQLVALGDASLNVANGFVARTALAAGNRLSISTNGVLENQGTLQGQALTLSAGGALVNNGLLTAGSGDSSLSGSRIAMNGAGSLQGGGNVTLNSGSDVTVDGFTGTRGSLTISAPGAIVNTALLYAGQNLSLLANSIRNQRGDILAGNSLWMQRDAAGNANGEVINTSGTIESQAGDIVISTGHLLNTRDGLQVTQTSTQNTAISGLGDANLSLPYTQMADGTWGYYDTVTERTVGSCGPNGSCTTSRTTTYHYAPFEDYATQKFEQSQTQTTVVTSGGSARIASARDLILHAASLENQASNLLAGRNAFLSGNQLNNQSWQAGTSTDYLIYQYGSKNGGAAPFATIDGDSYVSQKPTIKTINFNLVGHEQQAAQGELYRAVIQAGGNVSASFSGDISNTNTTANAGWSGNTLATPGISGLAAVSQVGAQQRQQMVSADRVAVSSPQWFDQLQAALQQVNAGSAVESITTVTTPLFSNTADSAGRADLGKTASLSGAPVVSTATLRNDKAASVDTSAYPLPSGSNGYFVAADSKSPYLITLNPKLNALGQLNDSLFDGLNALLGRQPGTAPQESRQQYTDVNTFLGSSYLLDRLNLKPEQDYRFLGDAAFDTRYVSNVVLNQTGSRYLNGIGSELDQMRYLMDNAAAQQQSLGLQFGVSLSAAQIAALDGSIIWWEATTVNGETVMVPKVYLSPKDVAMRDGSVIAGNNVSLAAGNLTNSGSTVTARDDLSINSDNSISNLNAGLLNAGGDLQLSALNNINNVSAAISGAKVALESLNGDISNTTATRQWQLSGGSAKGGTVSATQTLVGQTASIAALDSLSLKAGNDISVKGASLSAGGDLLMDAWHDIAVSSNQLTSGEARSGIRGVQNASDSTVSNSASQIAAGKNLVVSAGHDLSVTASNLNAGGNAALAAGNDLNLNSAGNAQNSAQGNKESHAGGLDRTSVSSGGNLTLAAGQDISSQAAALGAGGDAGLSAGRDIRLEAAATGSGYSEKGSKKTVISETVRQQGTEMASGGNTTLVAGRDITANAADVTAKQDIALQAGRDVNLNTATESDYLYREETKTKKGLLSKKTTHTIQEDSATQEKGTLLSGDNVSVRAGSDLLVSGSQVVGDGQVALAAGNNLAIAAATNTDSSWRFSETRKSGLMGTGGIGISIGSSKSLSEMRDKGSTQSQSASTVGSTGGNLSISAGKQLQVSGSDLVAGGSMALQGDSVAITPGHDLRSHEQRTEQRTSGLTLALSGAVGEAVNQAVAAAQSAKQESDGRLAALQATKAVLSGVQAEQAGQIAQIKADPNNGIGVSISLTTQQSKSQQQQRSDTVSGSTLNAGKDLSITATGKGNGPESGNLLIAGGRLKAAGDTSLQAANDITLSGAANTQQTTGSNSSSGGGVGLSFGAGKGSMGLSIFASVNGASGHETGNGTAWSETTVDSGGTVSLSSGRDTTLSGAQVSGNRVVAEVGRDLSISSQQDSDKYDSTQSSFGAGGSFTFGTMTGSGYVNASRDRMHSSYDSVQEQSGLYAGNGGFDVTVGNHTQLNGGVIASTADAEKNTLDTGTLGFSDIRNEADYKTAHQGIGVSSGASMGGQFAGNMANTLLAGAGGSGHAEGTTQSAVSAGTIVVRNGASQQQDVATLSRDAAGANDSISPIFNKEKEQQRLQMAQLIGEVGAQAGDIARTQGDINGLEKARADNKNIKVPDANASEQDRENYLAELRATPTYKNEMLSWGTGSAVQQGIQAATAAIQGLAGGNLAGAIAGGAAPYLAEEIHKLTEGNPEAQAMAHAVVGAVVAQASGNSALAGAAGAVSGELMAKLVMEQLYPGKKVSELTETEKQIISALGTLAGGVAGDSTAGAVAGAQAGKNAVENNYLSQKQQEQKDKEIAECQTVACKAGAQAKWTAIDLGQDGSFAAGMVAGVPAGLYDTVDGIVKTASSPVETYEALKTLFNSGDVLGNVSDAVKQSYIDRINQMETEYQKAGASGSFNAGVEGGKLVTDIAGLLAGGAGVVKGGAVLTEKVVAKVAGKAELAAAKAGTEIVKTGTVFDSIKATQPAIPGTSIPKSFELNVNGQTVWVNPNATKHMGEYLTRNGLSHSTTEGSQLCLQVFRVLL
ncbi:hemagglutinin repeat-containing protein [Erwinia mallotivora]|uniref:hemagglutinin repeat-containing protein n=1 Tax=Erwinia mallotivora TaxID=69222 RepID=UPI0021C00E7D|nr:hemagglutinin repeat-containing protein [Erwinia mallotivora]